MFGEFGIGSTTTTLADIFCFSDHLSACNCFDIARKSSVLVNRGNIKGYENNIINVFIQSIIKITIYSIAMGLKRLLFSTNSIAKLLVDGLLSAISYRTVQ